jgi:hypothetical protein
MLRETSLMYGPEIKCGNKCVYNYYGNFLAEYKIIIQ